MGVIIRQTFGEDSVDQSFSYVNEIIDYDYFDINGMVYEQGIAKGEINGYIFVKGYNGIEDIFSNVQD